MFGLSRKERRKKLRETPLSGDAWAIILRNVPYVRSLDEGTRAELGGLVQVFLAEKHFEGCAGLELTSEMRLTIAAEACILLLHRENDVYPAVDTILVYPHAYRAGPQAPSFFAQTPRVAESQPRSGEMSWKEGIVVVAWDHVRAATHSIPAGENLVLHEFAHALDAEDGCMDGAPPLGTRGRYVRWAKVLGDELATLERQLDLGTESDLRAYAATNPREFFAVVTEQFFEVPHTLRREHPSMYRELAEYYRQDPAAASPQPERHEAHPEHEATRES